MLSIPAHVQKKPFEVGDVGALANDFTHATLVEYTSANWCKRGVSI